MWELAQGDFFFHHCLCTAIFSLCEETVAFFQNQQSKYCLFLPCALNSNDNSNKNANSDTMLSEPFMSVYLHQCPLEFRAFICCILQPNWDKSPPCGLPVMLCWDLLQVYTLVSVVHWKTFHSYHSQTRALCCILCPLLSLREFVLSETITFLSRQR